MAHSLTPALLSACHLQAFLGSCIHTPASVFPLRTSGRQHRSWSAFRRSGLITSDIVPFSSHSRPLPPSHRNDENESLLHTR